jgi:hypothetical protein
VTIGEGLRAHLLSSSSWQGETLGTQIAAIVAATPSSAQIYRMRLPQGVLKSANDTSGAITIGRVSSLREGHLRGTAGLNDSRFQIDCWARTQDRAEQLGNLVRRRLDGFRGEWSDDLSPETSARVTVLFGNEVDMVDEDLNGGLGRHSADYRLIYSTAGGVL